MHQKTNDTNASLHKRTLELLRKDETPLATLAIKVGLPFYWLKAYKSGAICDPSVNRVQRLYEHLTGKRIAV